MSKPASPTSRRRASRSNRRAAARAWRSPSSPIPTATRSSSPRARTRPIALLHDERAPDMKKQPSLEHLKFPGESAAYRAARNALLDEEIALRRQVERVAAQRRALPEGGIIPEDYQFEGENGPVKLSELFQDKDTLAIYSFMFGPEREQPCPGCTHFLDGLDGTVQHITQRLALAVVAKSPFDRLRALAKARGWRGLRLLS